MDNTIYAKRKIHNDVVSWNALSGLGLSYASFNFTDYNFKLNDVVYKTDSPEWRDALHKAQVWDALGS